MVKKLSSLKVVVPNNNLKRGRKHALLMFKEIPMSNIHPKTYLFKQARYFKGAWDSGDGTFTTTFSFIYHQ